jgi:dihydropyrimidinase
VEGSGVTEPLSLVVRGGTVVTPNGTAILDIGITGETISVIGSDLDAERIIDAEGCLVVPGAIDLHVHLNATPPGPDPAFADDFLSGTQAALTGGVTTIGQMSFPDDGLSPSFESALLRDHDAGQRDSLIDYLLHPSVVVPNAHTLRDISTLRERGYVSLKLVLNALDWDSSNTIIQAVSTAGKHGVLPMLHCEDEALIRFITDDLVTNGQGKLENYPQSRPVFTEQLAVDRAIAVCEATGSPIYIVHLSSAAALESVRRAKARGLPVYAETRPIYLYLTREAHLAPDGGKFIGMPPLRDRDDVEALWAGLADGTIDTIASDHAPWRLEHKVDPALDIASARKGVADLDTYLPMLYTEGVLTGRITLERMVQITASSPAKLFGLTGKGSIAVGFDADLAILDPRESRRIDGAKLRSRAGYSVYDGRMASGWPHSVVSRGEVVFSNGTITATPGRGRFLNEGLI